MILRDDMSFNMDLIKRALVALRERTETSFYVHDLRDRRDGNMLSQMRGVLSSGNRIAYLDIQRSIDVNDGDILSVRSADGRTLNYFVFDVQKNRFAPNKYTMHAMLWTLPVDGFGHCGRDKFDDMHGRREARLETADIRRAG